MPFHVEREEQNAHSRWRLDVRIEREILAMPEVDTTKTATEATQVTAVSIDSAWLKHCVRTRFRGRPAPLSLALAA
jgi:hypothetical protein